MRVLIVEDHYAIVNAYRDACEPKGVDCVFAASYEEFLDLAEPEPWEWDAVWTDDQIIGRETGADVAWWMRENEPDVPLVRVAALPGKGYPEGVPRVSKATYSFRTLLQKTQEWIDTGEEPDWHG